MTKTDRFTDLDWGLELAPCGATPPPADLDIDIAMDDLFDEVTLKDEDLIIQHAQRKGDCCSECEVEKPVVKSLTGKSYCGKCAFWNQTHLEMFGEV